MSVNLPENTPVGNTFYTARARDSDLNGETSFVFTLNPAAAVAKGYVIDNVCCFVNSSDVSNAPTLTVGDLFSIHSTAGSLSPKVVFDYEVLLASGQTTFSMTLRATEASAPNPNNRNYYTTLVLEIIVIDANGECVALCGGSTA